MGDASEDADDRPSISATQPVTLSREGPAAIEPFDSETRLAASALVGRYRIRRLVGEGGMGRVYLARDTALGRSVALKIVRRAAMGQAEVERFLIEARTTAQLNHPHIVAIHDVGEHQGMPYLALEYLEGQSLAERARRERLSRDEVLRIGRDIADALAHAHAAGVRHCDLKPSNVVLPKDGRLRVVDFGLALTAESADSRVVAGTPDWMAPEQWLGEPISDKTDVFALGVMLYELFEGAHPFGMAADARARRASVLSPPRPPERPTAAPRAIADLVQQSLARDPEVRPTASAFRARLEGAIHRPAARGDASPYRGLSAFAEEHAAFFFGRDAEVDVFLERLREAPILPVVGPTGAGKTSFLYAGVVARLRATERWKVFAMRPGADPFLELARAIDREGDAHALAADLHETPTLLALRLATLAAEGARVLLVVDQLEELFNHDLPEATVQRFLDVLTSAADDGRDPVRVVMTIRDDFIGRVPAFQEMFVLKRLGIEQLSSAIAEPLARCDYAFEDPRMLEEILAEIGEASASLPLLQFACDALWQARDEGRRLLVRAAFERLGRVAGALARHADGVIAELDPESQRTARHLLLRLVAGAQARRIIEREALLADRPAGTAAVLDRLVRARLLVQRRPPGEPATFVELAHESMIRSWGTLARWIDESREERRLLDELEEATRLWARRGRRAEETWSASDIAVARRRGEELALELPPSVETFLAEGEKRHAMLRRRSRNRAIAGIAAAAVVTIASLAVANEFRKQKLTAEDQAKTLRLAGGNLGQIDLVLSPYDWVDGAMTPVAASSLPSLSWRFYGAREGDVHAPGDPLPASLVHVIRPLSEASADHVERVEVPGGMAFLRIDGRGREGEDCPPSWIRLQSLPGFVSRADPPRVVIRVPTCRASAANMVDVPAGPFVYGGPGEPPTAFSDYVEEERVVSLPAFAIDRTEVSNAAFAPFAEMASLTGYPVPRYPTEGALEHAGDPDRPVAAIDAFEAQAFCRYMGKRLPGDYEWTKAARGGADLPSGPNPHPKRLFPWGAAWDPHCANAGGAADGFEWAAPVGAFPCGASPYGVLNLAGNVSEWISKEGQVEGSLRVVRGGDFESPVELQHTTTVFRNAREDRFFMFNVGVRCVREREGT